MSEIGEMGIEIYWPPDSTTSYHFLWIGNKNPLALALDALMISWPQLRLIYSMLTSSGHSTLPAVQIRARGEAGYSYYTKLVQRNPVHEYTQTN